LPGNRRNKEIPLKRICVNCGSKSGARAEYEGAAMDTGKQLADNGLELVYGGGDVGLMGVLARSCLSNGGSVTGVIPRKIFDKVPHIKLNSLYIVNTMHERKKKMAELSDGFIALPGGYGTFEEIFEAVAWLQLGYHSKPCAIYNVCGYFDKLIDFLDNCLREGFLKKEHRDLLVFSDDLEEIFFRFREWRNVYTDKWK
jgi:uncharacterized protein (TIGR00730 family)